MIPREFLTVRVCKLLQGCAETPSVIAEHLGVRRHLITATISNLKLLGCVRSGDKRGNETVYHFVSMPIRANKARANNFAELARIPPRAPKYQGQIVASRTPGVFRPLVRNPFEGYELSVAWRTISTS
ncbi:MAG TPA: hypothetical protein VK663_10850 [Burkholderiales bacterium]|nr:hypothetical protein [Burkholderiales bacterium]